MITTGALALVLQWGLLIGFVLLLPAAVWGGYRRPVSRPASFAVGVIAGAHTVYYALFLIWPEVLGAQETMLFSISLRYMILFLTVFVLVLTLRGRWNK